MPARMLRIRTGGQTGVDRAALDAAMVSDVGVAGWCPRGRWAEDGRIPERYPLRETAGSDPSERTRQNVLEADATLILSPEPLVGGTAYTHAVAAAHGKPLMVVDPATAQAEIIAAWIVAVGARDLNVAGPRESEVPGIYRCAYALMRRLIEVLREAEPGS